MTPSDYIFTSLNNIRKNRLRSILTIIGVAVAIGALTSMMSFGIGMQNNIRDSFEKNHLITQITVSIDNEQSDSVNVLNDSVLAVISALDGVEKAFFETTIPAKLKIGQAESTTTVKAIPGNYSKYFDDESYMAGGFLTSDTIKQIIVTDRFIKDRIREFDTINNPDSILHEYIGKEITLSAISIDFNPQNLFSAFSAIMSNKLPFRDSLTSFSLVGVVKQRQMNDWGTGAYISQKSAENIPQLNFDNVWDILNQKNILTQKSATVFTKGIRETESVQKKVQEMGYSARSILDNLEEVKKAFLIMDSLLGAIGIMALFIATLGLVNTLIMSIYERTHEIGILKSLGARNQLVRNLFIIEAGCIGFIGAVVGIPMGWGVTRVADFILFSKLFNDIEEEIHLFSFPWYLIIGAVGFAVIFSIVAGLYPAARASRIDPVKALRHE
ncbi:MAG: FtsX-like permease family protein [Bacteroidales bacterium]|nr:FtsX-like permease family protein [Bacteroidales bacterium]MBN2818035.1 FtsX-like permease family protein [Bacteroidales bacterium]